MIMLAGFLIVAAALIAIVSVTNSLNDQIGIQAAKINEQARKLRNLSDRMDLQDGGA